MASHKRNPEPEHEEDMEDIDEDEFGVDPLEMVLGCLQTEDGESLTDVMKGISKSLETLNKLMVKLVASRAQLKNTDVVQ
jgi:hypothetical protein